DHQVERGTALLGEVGRRHPQPVRPPGGLFARGPRQALATGTLGGGADEAGPASGRASHGAGRGEAGAPSEDDAMSMLPEPVDASMTWSALVSVGTPTTDRPEP